MRASHRLAVLALVAGLAGGLVACDETAGLLETETWVEAAPSLSPDALLDDLELDPERAAELRVRLESMHDALLLAHELHAEGHELDEADREAAHAAMAEAHAQHDELMASLSDDERERFLRHAHEQMADHLGTETIEEAHERMQLHLDRH